MLPILIAALCVLPPPLTERLAARDWRTRDRAAHALAALGPLAVPTLERVRDTSPDAETRERCRVLLRPWAVQIAEREAKRLPCPLMWTGWESPDEMRRHYYQAMAELGYTPPINVPWWEIRDPDVRCHTTYLWTVSQLLQRRPRAEILAELERMAQAAKGEGQ